MLRAVWDFARYLLTPAEADVGNETRRNNRSVDEPSPYGGRRYFISQPSQPVSPTQRPPTQRLQTEAELPLVLVVAEKPRAARKFQKAMADGACSLRYRPAPRDVGVDDWFRVCECVADFCGRPCRLRFVSTGGNMSAVEFSDPALSLGGGGGALKPTDYDERPHLFFDLHRCKLRSTIERLSVESRSRDNDSARWNMYHNLLKWAKGAAEVVLALDYDLEGEGIGFDVLQLLEEPMRLDLRSVDVAGRLTCPRIWRVKFSTFEPEHIRRAMSVDRLEKPSVWKAKAVLLKHEYDLRFGIALSRHQTLLLKSDGDFMLRKALYDIKWFSFGPCISPLISCIAEPNWDGCFGFSWRCRLQLSNGAVLDYSASSRSAAQRLQRAIESNGKQVKLTWKDSRERRLQTAPLNSAGYMRECCEQLGVSPGTAMRVAENKLYLNGAASYVRTDATTYPKALPLRSMLATLRRWLSAAADNTEIDSEKRKRFRELFHAAATVDLDGLDRMQAEERCDDEVESAHPPFYPIPQFGRNGAAIVAQDDETLRYTELIQRRFIASLMPPCVVRQHTIQLSVGEETFAVLVDKVQEAGGAALLKSAPDQRLANADVDLALLNGKVSVLRVELLEPQRIITFADLVRFMDQNDIGTSGTIAKHIDTATDGFKRFALVDEETGDLYPSLLAHILAEAYKKIDSSLVTSKNRSDFETLIRRVSRGEIDYSVARKRLMKETSDVVVNFQRKRGVLIETALEKCAEAREAARRSPYRCAHVGCAVGRPCALSVRRCPACSARGEHGTVACSVYRYRFQVHLWCDLCDDALCLRRKTGRSSNQPIVRHIERASVGCELCDAVQFTVTIGEDVEAVGLAKDAKFALCLHGCGESRLLWDALFVEDYR